MNPIIKVEGKSGCPISVQQTSNGFVIIKKSKNKLYTPRLEKQAKKQIEFSVKNMGDDIFITPKVFNIKFEDDICVIEMQYINAMSYSSYLIKLSKYNIDLLLLNFENYFTANFNRCTFLSFNEYSIIICSKITELQEKFKDIDILSAEFIDKLISYLIDKIPKGILPIGPCHGDFTLSNMLFADSGKIYLIDFLDSFIESPIIDYIKLRQDTKYLWSPLIDKNNYTNIRLIQTLTYMDTNVKKIIENKYPIIKLWEKYLTVMNFARILPYANSKVEIEFLMKHIHSIIK